MLTMRMNAIALVFEDVGVCVTVWLSSPTLLHAAKDSALGHGAMHVRSSSMWGAQARFRQD